MEGFSYSPNMDITGSINSEMIIVKGVPITMRNFESKEVIRIDEVTSMFIKAECANVIIKTSDTDCCNIKLFGGTTSERDPEFSYKIKGSVITIEVDDAINGGMFTGSINLEIGVPYDLELIEVRTDNGAISVCEGVAANCIALKNMSGKINCYGTFMQLIASTHTGSVKLFVNAKNDVRFDVMSKNGDVDISLRNIIKNELSYSTKNGRIKNYFIPKRGGFVATGKINTKNGQIMIS